ncbi:hypothetical protein [Nonomuraea sp. NPDC001636]|uniref:hypothetical protein n=1 Tax=Actinomycetes TaxID=1760 RepID=UPI00331BB117
MTEPEHVPELCPNCGGLTVTRWDRVEGITSVSTDGINFGPAKVWIAEQPGPCNPTDTTKEN